MAILTTNVMKMLEILLSTNGKEVIPFHLNMIY